MDRQKSIYPTLINKIKYDFNNLWTVGYTSIYSKIINISFKKIYLISLNVTLLNVVTPQTYIHELHIHTFMAGYNHIYLTWIYEIGMQHYFYSPTLFS